MADVPSIRQTLEREFGVHRAVVEAVFRDPTFLDASARCTQLVLDALQGGRQVFLAGNGGSAADAQHIAAEFTGHYRQERRPLPVHALTTNTSSLTAIGNDYGYDHIFERQVRAYARKGDVLILISTSGNSPNCLATLDAAKALGVTTIAWTGRKGGKIAPLCDLAVRVPSDETPRIQEVHITLGHALCQAVDEAIIGSTAIPRPV